MVRALRRLAKARTVTYHKYLQMNDRWFEILKMLMGVALSIILVDNIAERISSNKRVISKAEEIVFELSNTLDQRRFQSERLFGVLTSERANDEDIKRKLDGYESMMTSYNAKLNELLVSLELYFDSGTAEEFNELHNNYRDIDNLLANIQYEKNVTDVQEAKKLLDGQGYKTFQFVRNLEDKVLHEDLKGIKAVFWIF